MKETGDPMARGADDPFDRYPYFGKDEPKK